MRKNWKAICSIQEPILRMALALLDPDSEIGKRIMQQLPEYFTESDQSGPYPLSFILALAHREGLKEGSNYGELHPASFDAIPEDVPTVTFDIYGDNLTSAFFDKLPDGIDPDAKQGDIVTWNGKEMVVLENNESCCEMTLAPAECVDANL